MPVDSKYLVVLIPSFKTSIQTWTITTTPKKMKEIKSTTKSNAIDTAIAEQHNQSNVRTTDSMGTDSMLFAILH